MEHPHLKRAREALLEAREAAGHTRNTQEQLGSLVQGLFEEDEGETTQEQSVPKIDRLAEVFDKLGEIEAEADDPTIEEHVSTARDHIREYMRAHPQGR